MLDLRHWSVQTLALTLALPGSYSPGANTARVITFLGLGDKSESKKGFGCSCHVYI